MAKISTYPVISVPTLNDLLIGTDVENLNDTKNFTIGDIGALIVTGNYVPYTGANQDVFLGAFGISADSFINTNGTASDFLKADGSLDSTIYQPAGNYITSLTGEATGSGPGVATVTLSNGAVIGKVLTGLTITGGSVSSTDNILQAFGKLQNQVNSLVGGVVYKGTWNASTNNPLIQSGVGTKGWYYVVNVAGSTNIDGITDWNVGDWIIFDGTAWQQVDNTDTVVSVNGQVGVVVLTTTNIAEGTNLYFTDSRARQAISLTTTGNSGASTYSNLTGILNVPDYTLSGLGGVPSTRELTINGTTYDLSANRSWSVGTVTSVGTSAPLTGGTITGSGTIGITQAGVSSDGYLSSTDWNTFNNKQNALTNPVTGTGTIYYLPMWSGVSALTDSILSYSSNVVTFNYNSVSGGTINYTNTGGTTYTYTIQMNNVGSPRQTYHAYTDGNVLQQINGNVVSQNLQSGQLVLPYYTTTTSFTGTQVGYLGFDATGNIITSAGPNLTGYVPYTGATGNVDLGEYGVSAGYFQADLTPTQAVGVGRLTWNSVDGTLDLGLIGGNVTLQIGQEQVARVVNGTGANLLESQYKAVKIIGAQGQRLQVGLARADNDFNSKDSIGIVTEDINNNQEGFITTSGLVRSINTTGSLQGETWSDGDTLYLSGTTFGELTNVKPSAPIHTVIIGFVVYAHANNGKIYVKVDNGYELDELHNVYIDTPLNNEGLFYTSATQLWENKSIATALGYTPFNLPSLTSGSVLFSNGTTIAQDNANFFWDDTNNRLGIRTSSPSAAIHIAGSTTASGAIARGSYIQPTLVAAANNDVLVGLDISPTFTNGAYTGVSNYSLVATRSDASSVASILAIGNVGTGNILSANAAILEFRNGPKNAGNIPSARIVYVQTTGSTLYPEQAAIDFYPVAALARVARFSYDSVSFAQPASFTGGNITQSTGYILQGSGGTGDGLATALDGANHRFRFNNYWAETVGNTAAMARWYNGQTATYLMYLHGTGNLAIGTASDAGYRLDVNGTVRFQNTTLVTGVLQETITTNRQTASYTLVLTDRGKLVEMNVATANNLTVPLNSSVAFPVGTKIDVAQYGAGQTTVVATGGVTIRSTNSWLKINARYGSATLIKIATDEWYLFGNLNA